MPVLSREALAEARAEGPSPAGKECYSCRARRPAISGTRSVFVYEGPARDAIHALKFRGLSAVAPEMAAQMAGLLTDWDPPAQSIVPVPLGGRRRRLRGYDQAELLAKELSRLTHLPLATRALVRRRATPPQARQESEDARRRNIVGAFAPGKYLPTGGVLLIDDVVTTGATLDACARVLLSEGIGPVFALTFAKDD
jgi:ComF family protein